MPILYWKGKYVSSIKPVEHEEAISVDAASGPLFGLSVYTRDYCIKADATWTPLCENNALKSQLFINYVRILIRFPVKLVSKFPIENKWP